MITLRNLLIALALLWVIPADAANKFLVLCTTACTWDNTNDAIWSTSTGGLNNTTHPTSADTATLDANSCVGGLTCTITIGANLAMQTFTWGACTASTSGCIIDNSGNFNITLNSSGALAFSGTGAGTRKFISGTGIYSITMTGANLFSMAITTNLDAASTFNATWSILGATASSRTFAGGGLSYGPITFGANSSGGTSGISGTNTFSSIVFGLPNAIVIGATTTVTNGLTTSGGSSTSQGIVIPSVIDTPAIITSANAMLPQWLAFRALTFQGGGNATCTNCFDLGRNTISGGGTLSITSPSSGSGGKIIGGSLMLPANDNKVCDGYIGKLPLRTGWKKCA